MMTFPRLSQYEDAGKLAKRLVMAAKMAMRNPADISGVVGDALRRQRRMASRRRIRSTR